MAFDTAANILNDAAVELGLYKTDLADPYDSSDANVVQLCRMLKALGQDLLRDYAWTHLQKEHTFNTVVDTPSYALPTDFARIVDGSAWDRTVASPVRGPLSPVQWQALQGASVSVSSPHAFRIFGNLFYLHSTPSSEVNIYYEYQSRYWVDAGGGSTPDAEAPTDGADSLFFDRRLLVAGLKLYWRRAKGFDTGSLQAEFERAIERAQGADGAAPVLSLNGGGFRRHRLLDGLNLPDSGWGT